jgi:hypothetical protein
MPYRDECLQRIEAARVRMDDALRNSPNALVLHETWHLIRDELSKESPPDCDLVWLANRLHDLQLHVYNSPEWQRSLEGSIGLFAQPHLARRPT